MRNFIGLTCVISLLSELIFRPYADNLKQALVFAVSGFPVLLALLTPAMRGEGPEMIPVYFALAAIIIAPMTAGRYAVSRPAIVGDMNVPESALNLDRAERKYSGIYPFFLFFKFYAQMLETSLLLIYIPYFLLLLILRANGS